ncbi:MAG: hypothetical protein NZV14_10475 [Bryobacteraceae bacterium]|nr:hypothetical protein [Bryobacteraceae bacterium]MDW8378578.1 hypothetical protein [Bryobacterales bacterium]
MPKLGLIAGLVVVTFLSVLGLMWLLIPHPRKEVDYFVMGGTSTMVSMGVLFILVIRHKRFKQEIFYKRRPRATPPDTNPPDSPSAGTGGHPSS